MSMNKVRESYLLQELESSNSKVVVYIEDSFYELSRIEYTVEQFLELPIKDLLPLELLPLEDSKTYRKLSIIVDLENCNTKLELPLKNPDMYKKYLLIADSEGSSSVEYEFESPQSMREGAEQVKDFVKKNYKD